MDFSSFEYSMKSLKETFKNFYSESRCIELFEVVREVPTTEFVQFVKRAIWFQKPPGIEEFRSEAHRARRLFEDSRTSKQGFVRYECPLCEDEGLAPMRNTLGQLFVFACTCRHGRREVRVDGRTIQVGSFKSILRDEGWVELGKETA